jgi:hypothetical protein
METMRSATRPLIDALALTLDGATDTRPWTPGTVEREAPAPWQTNAQGQDRAGDLQRARLTSQPLDHANSKRVPSGMTQQETSGPRKVQR